jgi:[ribosomal protein S5]-alanine N-acetyltransferase
VAKPSAMRVRLERPSPRRERELLEAVRRSRAVLRPWAAPPSTAPAYRRYLRRLRQPSHEGHLVVLRASGELVGVINLNEIVRGALRSAYLGYYGFRPYLGRGLMREGLCLVLRHAFGRLRLHRVEANIQPGNAASRALVRRLGFRREGFSPRYLKIAGRWRDHERWALLAEELPGPGPVAPRRPRPSRARRRPARVRGAAPVG